MQEKDRDPIVAICMLAALADGDRSPEEQAEFQRIVARLGGGDTSALTLRAHQGSLTVAEAVARLESQDTRRTAYEMALAVVYADGDANPAERAFLDEVRGSLDPRDDGAEPIHDAVRSVALAPLIAPPLDTSHPTSRDAALDDLIRKQALLAGALELLPQNLASLAIIPLQMRLVYRIGAEYGHSLDAPQIKDLLGAMGIGAAAQVLDGFARRILGGLGRGLFGRTLGGVVGGTAGMAAGAGLSFVTTYALGQAARQYYAQDRRLSREDLQALFQRFRGEAEALLPRVQQEIHAQSQHLDLKRLVDSIRGV
ncbi:MAG TPA: tellurite resistance TerB family protein [Gemmatimonadales bacterium]|nr:tellurite resistance TerB family protein [Gemmatimonadales bacterium]